MKNTALNTRGQTVRRFFYEVPPTPLFPSIQYSLIKSDKAYIRLDQVRGSYLITKWLLYK